MRATPTYTGGGKTTLCSWVKAVCRALDAAGCDSAHRGIAGGKLMILDGMGHNLPTALVPQLVEAIAANCARQTAGTPAV